MSPGGAIFELPSLESEGPGSCTRLCRALTFFGGLANGGIFVSHRKSTIGRSVRPPVAGHTEVPFTRDDKKRCRTEYGENNDLGESKLHNRPLSEKRSGLTSIGRTPLERSEPNDGTAPAWCASLAPRRLPRIGEAAA